MVGGVKDARPPFRPEGDFILQNPFDQTRSLAGAQSVQRSRVVGAFACLLLNALGPQLVGCSKGDSSQGAWPDPGLPGPTQSTEPETSPTDEKDTSSEPEPSSEGGQTTPTPGSSNEDESLESTSAESSAETNDSQVDSSSASGQQSTDSGSASSSSSSGANSSGSSSSTEQDTSSSAPDSTEDPAACEQELCVAMNHDKVPGTRIWRPGMHMFSFVVPSTHRRLARIELYEGLGDGITRASVRYDAGTSSGAIISRLSWAVDAAQPPSWMGADLPVPFLMSAFTKLWVVLEDNLPSSRASVANTGTIYSVWYKERGSQSWNESGVPLMFRAYCCKE